MPDELEAGDRYTPFRNSRLIPFLRDNKYDDTKSWDIIEYNENIQDVDLQNDLEQENDMYQYQTIAGDLLIDGAFNVNSTSVDAWVAHLSALRGITIPGSSTSPNETPFPRFFDAIPLNKNWNITCKLNDQQIRELALAMVKQVKLRGPFLSYADFVNRRIVLPQPVQTGNGEIPLVHPMKKWSAETRQSVSGLRGAIQSAIADAGINQADFSFELQDQGYGNPLIPEFPRKRFNSSTVNSFLFNEDFFKSASFNFSKFGLHAVVSGSSSDVYSYPEHPVNLGSMDTVIYRQSYGKGIERIENRINFSDNWFSDYLSYTSYEYEFENYEDTFSFGEAPDNILAVENLATAANKPGWLMQADVLTPLASVSSVRSDTFVIRVMGECPKSDDQTFTSRSWIELTVQRTPDYVKSHLDSAHHRPHEPFDDRDFNGFHNDEEPWLDLNQNGFDEENNLENEGPEAGPDLPGVGNTGALATFKDGLQSDLFLNKDP